MSPPDYDDSAFPAAVHLSETNDGEVQISSELEKILVSSRQSYDWPNGTGTAVSQQRVIDLEAQVAALIAALNPANARIIIREVCLWGGNNNQAQAAIEDASLTTRTNMMFAIRKVMNPSILGEGLDSLCAVPGIGLVMATKIYRFCCPDWGIAVDRHASYFFNSLSVIRSNETMTKATRFNREWANGRHSISRLAVYHENGRVQNRDEFIRSYLPCLTKIASGLNAKETTYFCAAMGTTKIWRSADVEMAAYYWWAHNGPR